MKFPAGTRVFYSDCFKKQYGTVLSIAEVNRLVGGSRPIARDDDGKVWSLWDSDRGPHWVCETSVYIAEGAPAETKTIAQIFNSRHNHEWDDVELVDDEGCRWEFREYKSLIYDDQSRHPYYLKNLKRRGHKGEAKGSIPGPLFPYVSINGLRSVNPVLLRSGTILKETDQNLFWIVSINQDGPTTLTEWTSGHVKRLYRKNLDSLIQTGTYAIVADSPAAFKQKGC